MNNVTYANQSKRQTVWEIYNYYSNLGEPAYRIKMSRLLYGCDLYFVRKVSDTRWIGIVKRVSLRRRIKIVMDAIDIQVIEKAIGRKLEDKEYFGNGQEVDLTCHHYEGLTLYGVLSANIGKGMAYRSEFVSIVPYVPPVTLAPVQPVISADDAYRQRLHNEMVTLVSVEYAPMGAGLPRWKAIATFEGKEVRFPIFSEHAIKFVHAGHGALPKFPTLTTFTTELNVVLNWNEPHHDLRIEAVLDKQGKPHKVGEGIPALPVATDEQLAGRTEFQKKIGAGRYANFDFKAYDKGFKKTG